MPPFKRCLLSPVHCILYAAISCLCCSTAHASEFSLLPSITVSEEYNDNVFETTNDRISDYITTLMPGIALMYSAPFWDWDLNCHYDYRYYANNSRNGDNPYYLDIKGKLRLIDDFMFLDVNDTYDRVSLNIARDRTQESLFINQSDSNIFTASPYFLFHPAPKVTMKTGARYMNVWYKNPNGIDRRDYIGFANATYAFSPRLDLTADYTYTHEASIMPFDRQNPYIGFRYEYKDKSFFFGQAGYSWFSSKNGGSSNDPFWNAGITHTFDHFSVTLTSGVQFPVDPLSGTTRETDYSFAVNKELKRGTVGASVYYSDYKVINAGPSSLSVSNKYGAAITASHELTTKLNGTISGSIERYNHTIAASSYTRRIYINPALTYTLPRDFTVALNYVFVDSYSPGVLNDTYQVNRVILELKKSFGKVQKRPAAVNDEKGLGTGDQGPGSVVH